MSMVFDGVEVRFFVAYGHRAVGWWARWVDTSAAGRGRVG
jgi:hypothetical protein